MVAPLIAAALPALIGGVASGFGQMMANNEAKESSIRQMDFQKETLRHQYQWGMEDMRKAGLNPILAYKQGGAGSASGADYTPGNVGAAAVSGGSTAQSSALATRAQDVQLENLAADTRLKGAQDKTQAALQVQAMAQAGQASTQSALNQALKTKTDVDGLIATENLQSAKALAAKAAQDEAFFSTPDGQFVRTLGNVGRELNPFMPSTSITIPGPGGKR
ncbi:DNA pilot protein [Blackfly microvirus SF02]|uniref:DNA pilot protein n=1 Tax=Blackfly microvirus SF02 TaxID=2576452 RepID=A0A4P8PKQ8_9VIRU|nr:DNA pilot protein [Blackfly microvirus SF02]